MIAKIRSSLQYSSSGDRKHEEDVQDFYMDEVKVEGPNIRDTNPILFLWQEK